MLQDPIHMGLKSSIMMGKWRLVLLLNIDCLHVDNLVNTQDKFNNDGGFRRGNYMN